MVLKVLPDKSSLSKMAAEHAAEAIGRAICDRGQARIIAATAASQFEFLDALTKMPGIDWQKVEVFHLDEYIGLPITHPGSFRKMLLDHLIKKTGIAKYHLLDGDADPAEVVRRVGKELTSSPVDVAFVGIGENGHLAFNDPPADFDTGDPYLIVQLDEACRRQQVGEGWFARIDEVPERAISMSIRPILEARAIGAVRPEGRQALSVLARFGRAEFHGTSAVFGLVLFSSGVASSVGQFASGRFLDVVATRRGLTWSVTFYSVAAMLTSLATGLRSFCAFR